LKRWEISFIIAIVTGIAIGKLIKRANVAILIGLLFGMVAAIVMAKRHSSKK
jgi:F0F1-type ATP synthase assembly protein I